MVTSCGETSGFSAVGAGKLAYVNGGKGGGGNGISFSVHPQKVSITATGGNISATAGVGLSYSSNGGICLA